MALLAEDTIAGVRDSLTDLVQGLDCAAAAIMLRARQHLAIAVSHGLSQAAVDAYVAHWHRLDPWLSALPGPFAGRALCAASMPRTRFGRSAGFQEGWLSPNALGSAGIAEIAEGGGTSALLCVWRRAGSRSLARADALVLRSVARALALVFGKQDLAIAGTAAAAVADCAAAPIFVLKGDSTLIWANPAADAMWDAEGPLRRAGLRITHRHAAEAGRFAQAVSEAAHACARPAVLGLETEGGTVPLRLHPLALAPERWGVVLVAPPRQSAPLDAGTIAAALGLTRAQSEVAMLLCRGLETAEIATLIGISPNTLNGHLRDLYDRLRAANRVQAAVRILNACAALSMLSPPARAGGGSHSAHFEGLHRASTENILISTEGANLRSSAVAL